MRRPSLPSFLEPYFDVTALDTDAATLVAVDRDHRILWTNPAWAAFALANRGDERTAHGLVGTSYFDGMTEPFVEHYRVAFEHARATKTVFEHEYECSSAEVMRRFRLRALPLREDGLLLEHSLVVVEAHDRPTHEPLDALYRTSQGLVVMCGNCRRTRRSEDETAWHWVPAFVAATPPRTSHGICPTCAAFYYGLGRR